LEVVFSPEQQYNQYLPEATPVEVVGLAKTPSLNLKEAVVQQYFPVRGTYKLKLREPFEVPAESSPGPVMQILHHAVRAVQHVLQEIAEETEELTLTPGARLEVLQDVPARFVQIRPEAGDLGQILEAMESQREAATRNWTALPRGHPVLITGLARCPEPLQVKSLGLCTHFQTPESCSSCRLSGYPQSRSAGSSKGRGKGSESTQLGLLEALDFQEEPASVAGPLLANGMLDVRLPAGHAIYSVAISKVMPIVQSTRELSALTEFQLAQAEADNLRLDLPLGQRVEVLDEAVAHGTQLAVTCGPFNPGQKCYAVFLEPTTQMTEEERAQLAMARQCGIDDLLGMTAGQLVDLWDNFGLPRRGLESPDAFLEKAMQFLEAVRPEPLHVPALQLRPLIQGAEELFLLRQRHNAARTMHGISVQFGPTEGVVQDGAAQSSATAMLLCGKCGGVIRGCPIEREGQQFHFGCMPE